MAPKRHHRRGSQVALRAGRGLLATPYTHVVNASGVETRLTLPAVSTDRGWCGRRLGVLLELNVAFVTRVDHTAARLAVCVSRRRRGRVAAGPGASPR